jgi:hypothetical protein
MFSCCLCVLPCCPSSLPVVALRQRRATAERVRLSVGFTGQKAACRLDQQPSKWLCIVLGSQPTTRPLQAADFASPLFKVKKCAVFTCGALLVTATYQTQSWRSSQYFTIFFHAQKVILAFCTGLQTRTSGRVRALSYVLCLACGWREKIRLKIKKKRGKKKCSYSGTVGQVTTWYWEVATWSERTLVKRDSNVQTLAMFVKRELKKESI